MLHPSDWDKGTIQNRLRLPNIHLTILDTYLLVLAQMIMMIITIIVLGIVLQRAFSTMFITVITSQKY